MTMQGGEGGVAAFMEYAFVAAPGGQTRFVGADSKGFVLNYASGFLWAIVDGFWVAPDDLAASDGSSVTFSTAVDQGTHVRLIAISPFNIANVYSQIASDTLYAKRRNRIIDPGMRISQEQGSNLLTLVGGVGMYASDSVSAYRQGTTGTATVQRIALLTPGGSPYRNRITVTAANAAPASTDLLLFSTRIEGVDVADFKFGTAGARTVTARFGCRSSMAGTFAVVAQNYPAGGPNRTWVGSVIIAPAEVGVDVVKSVTLTGDTTGAWATDNSAGFQLAIGLCVGSGLQGVAGWQSGGFYGSAGCANLMAVNGSTFDLFDLGLYDVTGLQNGIIPPFELGSYAEDLLKCQRYYELLPTTQLSNLVYMIWSFKAVKRTAPSITVISGSLNGATVGSGGNDPGGGTCIVRQNAASNAASDALLAINARL